MRLILSLVFLLALCVCPARACDFDCSARLVVPYRPALRLQIVASEATYSEPVNVRETVRIERQEINGHPAIVQKKELIREYQTPVRQNVRIERDYLPPSSQTTIIQEQKTFRRPLLRFKSSKSKTTIIQR